MGGSHGTGMDVETVTPLAVWGAGVKKLEENVNTRAQFNSLDGFNISYRIEVNQADLAPLMSSMIGVNIPVNNVGVLPVDILDLHPHHQVEAMLAQIDQLLAQYLALQQSHKQVFLPSIFHRPFTKLSEDIIAVKKLDIKSVARQGHFKEANRQSRALIELIMEGVEYYQRYQRNILLFLIKISFIGCALLNLAKLCCDGRKTNSIMRRHSATVFTMFSIAVTLVNIAWFCQRLPYHFLLYYLSPLLIWSKLGHYIITRNYPPVSVSRHNTLMMIQIAAVLLILRESFFDRRWLSLGFLTLLIHPVLNSQIIPRTSFPFWLLSLSVLSIFPWLPPLDGRMEHSHLVLGAGVMVSVTSLYILTFILERPAAASRVKILLSLSPGVAGVCVHYTAITPGLSIIVQMLTWIIFICSTPLALTTRPFYLERTPALCLAPLASYNLLSLSYEAIFMPVLCLTMAFWSSMEDTQSQNLYKKDDYFGSFLRSNREKIMKRSVTIADVSCILSFLFIIFYSFFATGNIASLNSFDPSSIRCFVAIFNPFLMGGLLLIKILIPFLVVSLFFIQITWFRACDFGLVMNVLQMFCDILGLMFFNLVRNEGSWLDIGSSISHFVIVEGTTIFVVILLYFAALISKCKLK